MIITITGSEGFIGKYLRMYLTSQGHDVQGLDLSLGHDLTDENFVKEYFRVNKPDCLINSFALNHHINNENNKSSLFDISLESFEDYMKINLTTLFSVCREYSRDITHGNIINFSSIYGLVSPNKNLYDGEEKHIGYSVSKMGVIMLSKHLATHLSPNIRVNTICLGGVENKQSDEFKKRYSKMTPMGRMMKRDEITGIVDYLISDKSSYTTGTEFKIDGGWTSW